VCSILTVKTRPGELVELFPALLDPEGVDGLGAELRVHGYLKKELAPVIFSDGDGTLQVRKKYFSLCPDWAKRWPFEFETYNARLSRPKRNKDSSSQNSLFSDERSEPIVNENILSVPSFRDPFRRGQTCLVPLTGAVESCYFGESAGHVVRFTLADESLIFAAGLWNDWVNIATGEVIPTFTLLTDDPDPIVFRNGHDRGLVVLNSEAWKQWLLERKMSGQDRLSFVRKNRIEPAWVARAERALKNGWQKRAPSPSDISQMKVWSGS